MKATILVVDDEPDVIELLSFNLKAAEFSIETAVTGKGALEQARATKPDLILLDVMLPEMDGFEVCKCLRQDPATARIPIIMVTAKTAEIDRVLGLEFGADDYVTKPFSPRELILRIKNLLKRNQAGPDRAERFQIGPLLVDVPRHLVAVNGRSIELTTTEFKLITVLAQRRGRVQSRDQLLQEVWEYDSDVYTRTVDTHVRRLRNKLGAAAPYLETVRGVGYRLIED
jgi:DNA-binding response OmpR family regulator